MRTVGSTVARQTNPADELLARERKRMGEAAQRPFASQANTLSRTFASIQAEFRRQEFRPTNDPMGLTLHPSCRQYTYVTR